MSASEKMNMDFDQNNNFSYLGLVPEASGVAGCDNSNIRKDENAYFEGGIAPLNNENLEFNEANIFSQPTLSPNGGYLNSKIEADFYSSLTPETDKSRSEFESNSDSKNNSQLLPVVKEKKKAQNRAAQKAFRERKEARLKELEQKLHASESEKTKLQEEMDLLRKSNMEIHKENRSLLQKSRYQLDHSRSPEDLAEDAGKYDFPTKHECYKVDTQQNEMLDLMNSTLTDDSTSSDKLMTVPETWEYLSRLNERQDFDVYEVMQKLKGSERCHSLGPAYSKQMVDQLALASANKQ